MPTPDSRESRLVSNRGVCSKIPELERRDEGALEARGRMDDFEGRFAALGEKLAAHASQVAGAYEALVERINFIEGQLMAAQAALRAAIVASSDRQAVASRVEKEIETLSAIALQSRNSTAVVAAAAS
jgi:hypothetical protein